MIGKKVDYKGPEDGGSRWSTETGIILDKILIQDTDYYLIDNINGDIDTVRCDKIVSIKK